MTSPRAPGVALLLGVICSFSLFSLAPALDIPLEVEQPPTITAQSPSSLIAFPFDESFFIMCEARGNPEPTYRWTKNGREFDPHKDSKLINVGNGAFAIPNKGNLTQYQGKYRCHASNKLGTAISEEIEFIVPHVPKFPKEKIEPLKVEEGESFILECKPPKGIPPLQIYWMTLGLQHIEQDDRVSMGLDGNLYFANALVKDSRRDYCCYAAFPRIRTIVQKTAMSVIVSRIKSANDSDSEASANAILERKPRLLVPPGGKTEEGHVKQLEKGLVKGDKLELECIAEGFPTPTIEWTKEGKVGHEKPEKATIENHGKLLTILKVDADDEGMYTCRAENSHGHDVYKFDVKVEEPPRWLVEPRSQLATIGSEVQINCSASGSPPPAITWRMNGQLLEDTTVANRNVLGGTIVLRNAQPDNSAVYQCEVSNRHGTLLANANIMVMNLPPMILTEDNQEYEATEGKSAIMHCKVFSSPPSIITWASVEDSARFSKHENGSLEIHSVERGDAGQYSCIASNIEGESIITASLDIKVPTRIVDRPQNLRILRGTTAHFTCLAEYDKSFRGDLETLWEKDDVELVFNHTENAGFVLDDGVLQIINVSHKDQGTYTCRVLTPLDEDSASAELVVLDVPDAPEDVVVLERKNKSARLKWVPGDDHSSPANEFVIEYEESEWEPGKWKELLRVPGDHVSAHLKLHGHVDYQFRVFAINAIGHGPPSAPTERIKTPPSAPDRNPENIKIEGRLPHEMDIIWEPLLPIEHNGPGLEYKVSYRLQGTGEDWKEHMVKRHSFVVKNTPTFVPYEIKIQARNNHGWGPEPTVVNEYSGEDQPAAAPHDVAVELMNNTLIKVNWTRVPKDKLNGHLGGYRVNFWRLRSLLDSKKVHGVKQTITLPGDRDRGMVPGLQPFSEYSLQVMAFNGRGNGPTSHPVTFRTPEGVPEKSPFLRATNFQKDSLTLVWTPPLEANGVRTGYVLQYQLINGTEEVGQLQTVNISSPDTTKWVLQDLEPHSRYLFYLRSCTRVGCGPPVSEEGKTFLESSSASKRGGIPTEGWFIGVMTAVALLTLIALIACFVNRNKGGKYSVKEKEDMHPDLESQGMGDDTFSDNDEKPLKGSLQSLSGDIKAADSGDSLVDYGDEEDGQFNEDGSFIGEYAGHKQRESMEVKGTAQSIA
ncbi:neural cell adhesion molecule L1-like protein isoform X2 [Conger conger]|uniref:neural cell adhesion molecule L1-like protein isoform X2 n=1 Tax=Conger conger TaxID=82655 RepID=UPI002A59F511|nr:neural cell adhesion molecule L1-like protein isoform X2 [Conger conger]